MNTKMTTHTTHHVAASPNFNDFFRDAKTFSLKLRLSHRAILAADIAICFAILFLAVSAVGNFKFLSYQIGDQKVRVNGSSSQMLSAINRATKSYKLNIKYPDGSVKSFTAANAGLSLNKSATLDSLRRNEPIINHLEWWKPIPASLIFNVNQSELNNFITQNATILTSKPTDASIEVSNGVIAVNNAKLGKEYGLANAATAITKQISSLNDRPLVLTTLPINPAVSDAQLAATFNQINAIKKEHIAIKIGGKTVVPSSKTIASWLSVKTNSKNNAVDVVVNGAAVENYLANLANSYSQVERDQVTATLDNGSTTVAARGQDGVYVGGLSYAEGTVFKNLLKGKNFSTNLTTSSVPFSYVTAGDWPKWIEVNVSTQRMYVYQNGQVVRTFLVSTGKPSTPTPLGTFYIWEKLTLQTMIGADYVQPNVPYINYFDHSGDAIHGNYWRPASVFGNYGTSHGCVGLEVSDAEWVYEWAPIGTPIVIHA